MALEAGGRCIAPDRPLLHLLSRLRHLSLALALGPQLWQAVQVLRVLQEAADVGEGGRARVGGLLGDGGGGGGRGRVMGLGGGHGGGVEGVKEAPSLRQPHHAFDRARYYRPS